MTIQYSIVFGLITLLSAAVAWTQTNPPFPGVETDQQMLHIHERVEELYLQGRYERAYLIYRKELAPRGDKYAQYMVGYMHLTGAGVSEDPATALAWYRLAAERDEPVMILARDELEKSLDPIQVGVADSLFARLRGELSDRTLILKLVQDDLELLRDRVGRSHSMSTSPMVVIDRRYGYISGAQYYQIIKNRVAARLDYLKGQVEIVDVEDAETEELAQIEIEIRELIAEIDKR